MDFLDSQILMNFSLDDISVPPLDIGVDILPELLPEFDTSKVKIEPISPDTISFDTRESFDWSILNDQSVSDLVMTSLKHVEPIPFIPTKPNYMTPTTYPNASRVLQSNTNYYASIAPIKSGMFINKSGKVIKGKPCQQPNCDRRAQSSGLCKAHGGGARCKFDKCTKSSQGGGFCRAHGGGKRCVFKGCNKGTQRNGFCYLHGGIRTCTVENCTKKDRGSGKCISHGGGRRCISPACEKSVRKGNFCQIHLHSDYSLNLFR